ncbi:MAG: hypothetical protein ABIH72_01095 [archaeon]
MKKEDSIKLAIVGLFAIAMAFIETVVVVYLRMLFYPNGFDFPLSGLINPSIILIEWVREFFTIVMLACVAFLAGKKFYGKLAYFFYSFAIWDIFYYIWLKVILDWPSSVLTWDLLFLIPIPWASPMIVPILYSLTIILVSILILNFQARNQNIRVDLREKILFISGSLIILYTFLFDYGKLMLENGYFREFLTLASNHEFMEIISEYIPLSYNWIIFFIGEILILASILFFYLRNKK